MLVVAHTKNGARINLAENDSDSQKEQESDTFHSEVDRKLSSRTISPELLEANKIIAERDQKIEELQIKLHHNFNESSVYNNNTTTMLILSNSLAMEIYNAIRNAISSLYQLSIYLYLSKLTISVHFKPKNEVLSYSFLASND
jgi:hypothetical protein